MNSKNNNPNTGEGTMQDHFVTYRIYVGLTQGIGERAGHAVKGKMVKDSMKVLDRYFKGYSIFNGRGVWEGKKELCKVFEIVAPNTEAATIKANAEEIRNLCNQACVMVTQTPTDMETI
jgi:hypothetical protein